MSLLWFRRLRRQEIGETAPAGPRTAQPPLGIRGLLLLNLRPSDGAAEIEHAPPLGSRDAVVEAVETLVPGIRFDEAGHASVERTDCRVMIDVGAGDPVHAAVAAAEGDAGIRLLGSLAQNQGWRIYAPRAGVFVDPDKLNVFAVTR